MSCFEDALCCCCQDKPFAKPDESRYSTPIRWNSYPKDLFGAIDFNYEETEGGVKVEQTTYPLVEMPDSMDCLSTRYFTELPEAK